MPTLVLIDEEGGNLKVFVTGGDLSRNINKKKKQDVLKAYRCPLCDKYMDEIVSSIAFRIL